MPKVSRNASVFIIISKSAIALKRLDTQKDAGNADAAFRCEEIISFGTILLKFVPCIEKVTGNL